MKSHSNKGYSYRCSSGFTLIEMMIYVVLLSILLSGFIMYAYSIHIQNIDLTNDINDAEKI